MKEVRVFAPATVANVSCGFDIFGCALNTPGDEVVVRKSKDAGVQIVKIEGDNGRLSKDAAQNTAGIAANLLLNHLQTKQGIEIELYKQMPLGSGLGSSAASAVASLAAINHLLGNPLPRMELLPFAMQTEKVVSGWGHADNAAAALLGGFILVRSYDPLDVLQLPVPDDLYFAVVRANAEINTKKAREILKPEIELKKAVVQWGNIAGLVMGLLNGDYDLISRSMNDVIVEPVRAPLIPHFENVKSAALNNGALGCSISGSGPSIFALCRGPENARQAGQAMGRIYKTANMEHDVYLSQINKTGPEIRNEVL